MALAIRIVSLLALGILGSSPAQAADRSHPVITGYGAITPGPKTANLPDSAIDYRVVFNITAKSAGPDMPNPSLVKVARFLNLLGSRDIHPRSGNIVAIVHGGATPLVLDDEAYSHAYGTANPNLPLIEELRAKGVEVHVCSQALESHKIARDDMADHVIIDLSAMTTLAMLQLQGYALIPD